MLRMVLTSGSVALVVAMMLIQGCDDNDRPSSKGGIYGGTAGNAAAAGASSTEGLRPATELCEGLSRGGESIDELDVPWDRPEMLGGILELGAYELVQLYSFRTVTSTDAGVIPMEDIETTDAAATSGFVVAANTDAELPLDGGTSSDGAVDSGLDVAANVDAELPLDAGTSYSSYMVPSGRAAQITILVEEYALRRVALWSGEPERAEAFLYATDGATLSLRSVCPTRGSEAIYGYSVVGETLALLVDPQHLEIYAKR